MFRRIFSCGGLLLLAGAVLVATPGSGWARGGHGGGGHFGGGHFGGGHFGGAHFGGARFGGYRGGFYRGGYHYGYGGYRHSYYPYYGYGYYPYLGYGYYPYSGYGYYPYADAYSGYGSAYTDVAPSYLDGTASVTPPASAYQSYYPATTGTSQPDNIAQVTVNVPPDAKVWFDDTLTTSAGAVRQFDSPPLTPGAWYSYDVKASWNENGHEVTQAQRVDVTAGGHVNVRFPTPRQSMTAK
jgi:uncharacterized protein (TIGR03000 family)